MLKHRRQMRCRGWGGLSPWVHNLCVAQDKIESLILAGRYAEADRRVAPHLRAVGAYYATDGFRGGTS